MNIGIIEDNEELLSNYIEYFNYQNNYSISFAFSNITEFKNSKNEITLIPNIILLDINLPGLSGIDGLSIIKNTFPNSVIVMLTSFSDKNLIFKALENGANGYLIKGISLEELKHSLESYTKNGSAISPKVATILIDNFKKPSEERAKYLNLLTPREKDIAVFLADGHTQKEAAEFLNIKLSTINHHLKSIYIKLSINTQMALIRKLKKNS